MNLKQGQLIYYSFKFYINHQQDTCAKNNKNKINLSSNVETINNELRDLYIEYIIFGAYPAVVLEKKIEIKSYILKQIINTYIKKDIRDLANIREINKFNQLIKVLASQSGNLLNILELSNILNLSQQTVKNYIFILENIYIIKIVYPFHKNIRSELSKMPKLYFEDTGLMNLLANKRFLEQITGQLFENSVYSELRKNIEVEDINFWRTNIGQEVDFIIEEKNIMPIEVKLRFVNKKLSSLKYFMDKYCIETGYVCALEKGENANNAKRPLGKKIMSVYPWHLNNLH